MSSKEFVQNYRTDKVGTRYADTKKQLKHIPALQEAVERIEALVGRIERVRLAGLAD